MPHASSSPWKHHSVLSLFVWMWGANFILAEVALQEMTPISFSVSRFWVGGVVLAGVFYLRGTHRTGRALFPRLQGREWGRMIAVAVLGAALAPWLGIVGLDLAYGARASLWLALGPVLSSAFGHVWGTERISTAGYVGIASAGLGTVVLAADGLRPGHVMWLGDLVLLLALAASVAEMHLIKPLAARHGAIPTVVMRTALGGTLYAALAGPSLLAEGWTDLSRWTWIAILVGGGVGVGVGQWVKVRALDALGPTRVVLYGNLVPVATLVLAWLTIGTNPTAYEGLAAGLILLGAFCLQVLDANPVADGAEAFG